MPKGRIRSAARNVFLSVASVVVFLGAAELLARLEYDPEEIRHAGIFEYDPYRVYRLKSNVDAVQDGQPVRTNSFGHRDREIPLAKPDHTYRVLVLGDSLAFGHGVPVEETFSEVLERRLGEELPETRFDVINTGVPGYSAFQEYYTLEENLGFEPDLVLLEFVPNDVTEPYRIARRFGGRGKDYHDVEDMPYYHFLLSQRSALYLFLRDIATRVVFSDPSGENVRERAISREKYGVEDLVFRHDDPEIRERWDVYLGCLDEIVQMCRERSVPLILLVSPYEFQLRLDPAMAYPQHILREFAAARGIARIDLLDLLRAESLTGDPGTVWHTYFLDHAHYTAAGHVLVADALLPVVLRHVEQAISPRPRASRTPAGTLATARDQSSRPDRDNRMHGTP